MAAEGLLFFVLGVVGLIAAVLWLSVPFMLYSIKSSLQEIQETLDDLREIDLEIARRLGPAGTGAAPPARPSASESLAVPPDQPSLRSQAEEIRRHFEE